MKLIALALLIAIVPCVLSHAEERVLRTSLPGSARVSPNGLEHAKLVVQKAIDDQKIHGAVLLAARHGQIVLHQALGWRNFEDRLPMQPDTLFKMASNTKPVIATCILQLVDAKQLGLDESVGKYIPSWNRPELEQVTIRHLLNHTSGLRIPTAFIRPIVENSLEHPDAPSLAIEVDRFAEVGIETKPGLEYSYNNPGFQVLGRLIEIASGKSLKDYLRDHVYQPLGMNDSWNHETEAPIERMARIYRWNDPNRELRWKPGDAPDYPIVRASGGMISTARDYASFCQMYLNQGTYTNKRLISKESVALATSIQTQNAHTKKELATRSAFYGLGWVVDRRGIFSHNGSDGTHAWVDPTRDLIVLMFTQSPGGPTPANEYLDAVLEACDEGDLLEDAIARPRLSDLSIQIGRWKPGKQNAITDVSGVQVGHETVVASDNIRTGVTAIKAHTGNPLLDKVPAAIHVANGFGKLVGLSQVEELGVLESPIVLTNTMSAFTAADTLVEWSIRQPGCEDVLSVNPVVGECNDGYLNDIRKRVVNSEHILSALNRCRKGRVFEGCIGAGTGTRCLGWKGGIGTSSRKLSEEFGGYTVGVLVQTNFGGSLTRQSVPGRSGEASEDKERNKQESGSCIMVIATDAPLDARRLKRLANRAPLGLASLGSYISHGSGDYAIAFSTSPKVRTDANRNKSLESVELLPDNQLNPLLEAVKDATTESVLNSMLRATTLAGRDGRVVQSIDPEFLRKTMSE